jgi:hypothetical protein
MSALPKTARSASILCGKILAVTLGCDAVWSVCLFLSLAIKLLWLACGEQVKSKNEKVKSIDICVIVAAVR